MDYLFLALESPLFPGAMLALFFALAARALTDEPELVLSETVRPLRPAPQHTAEVSASVPASVTAASTPSTASLPSPEPAPVEEFGSAICSESDSEPFTSDEPIRWL